MYYFWRVSLARSEVIRSRVDREVLDNAIDQPIRARRIGLQAKLDRRKQANLLAEDHIHRGSIRVVDPCKSCAGHIEIARIDRSLQSL